MKKSVLIAALAATGATLVPVSASAAPVSWSGGEVEVGSGDQNSGSLTIWDLYEDGSIGHSVRFVNGKEYRQVWCGESGGLMVDENYLDYDTFTIDTDANGDQVISGTGEFAAAGGTLDAAVEYRIYAEGDLLRTSYTLTNNTASAITFTPSMDEDIGDGIQSNGDNFAALTSSGDAQIDTTDWWWSYVEVEEDSNSETNDPVPTVVFSRFWGTKKGAADLGDFSFEVLDGSTDGQDNDGDGSTDEAGELIDNRDDDEVLFEDVTIAPGASYLWVNFYKMDTYDYTLVSVAVNGYDANLASATAVVNSAANDLKSGELTGRYARNLDLTVENNWGPLQLPTTGSDSTGIVLAGLALALMGGAVLVRRRATV